jgi:MFS transporter, DHA1 family, inner membrane transport protein
VPLVAADLAVSTATAALLSTAFALPYALAQPIIGPIADTVGKTKLISVCLAVQTVACLIGALAPYFSVLVAARIVSGVVAGGVFPVALALLGDRVGLADRQVAISRMLAAAMAGNLLGSSLSGVIGDLVGWRGVFVGMGVCALIATLSASAGFGGASDERAARFDWRTIPVNYRKVFANPKAKICYGAVFLEGVFVFGSFPYVAALLQEAGEPRASIAGLVIAAFGIGGLFYSATVSVLVSRLKEPRMMIMGGALMAVALGVMALDLTWPFRLAAFLVLGFGFFSLHGCIQIYATELAPSARASAMALHSSSYFLGQAVGPLYYGFGLAQGQFSASLLAGALAILTVGILCARWLPERAATPDQPRPR